MIHPKSMHLPWIPYMSFKDTHLSSTSRLDASNPSKPPSIIYVNSCHAIGHAWLNAHLPLWRVTSLSKFSLRCWNLKSTQQVSFQPQWSLKIYKQSSKIFFTQDHLNDHSLFVDYSKVYHHLWFELFGVLHMHQPMSPSIQGFLS